MAAVSVGDGAGKPRTVRRPFPNYDPQTTPTRQRDARLFELGIDRWLDTTRPKEQNEVC